jgi:hypothetical protein
VTIQNTILVLFEVEARIAMRGTADDVNATSFGARMAAREVRSGHPPAQDASAAVKSLTEPAPSWPRGFGILAAGVSAIMVLYGTLGLLALGMILLYQAILVEVNGFPIYVELSILVAILGLSFALQRVRDIQRWPSVAWLQIILAAGTATFLLLRDGEPVSKYVAIGAAVFTVVNGVEKLKKLYES